MEQPNLAMIPSGYSDRVLYSVIPNSSVGDFDVTRGTSSTRINKDGLIETITDHVPRLNYDLVNGVPSQCPSLLLEPQRTNVVPYSNDFSNSAWTKSASTIDSNTITSPDGTLNAVKLVENSANTEHAIFDNVITSTGDFSISIMVKASERSKVRVSNGSNSHRADFDLSNGTISNKVSLTSSDMISMPNDWYLCKISYNISSTAAQYMFLSLIDNSGNVSYQGDGSSGVYIYGAQLEVGSYSTSYIPTSGLAVTRSAEACNGAGNASTFNSEEGILFVEIAALTSSDTTNPFRDISISDGTINNTLIIYYQSATNTISVYINVGNVMVALGSTTSYTVTNFNKIAVRWKENDFRMYINGTLVYSDTSGASFSSGTLNRVNFDNAIGNDDFYGKCKDIRVYDTEGMTDTEINNLLTQLTQ